MPEKKAQSSDTQLAMQVVNHVREKIEDGTLQPGDKIPPEREFARKLKISRASLRTGIGYLAAMGVMNVRHGVGTFVADGPPEIGKSSLGLLGDFEHPRMRDAIARIVAAGKANGRSVGAGVGSSAIGRSMIDQGVQWIQLSGADAYLWQRFEQLRAEVG